MAIIRDSGSAKKYTPASKPKPQPSSPPKTESSSSQQSSSSDKPAQTNDDKSDLSPAAQQALDEEKKKDENNKIDPQAIHMNQFEEDPNGRNADCGPTSLAMALNGVGLEPKGADENSSNLDTITAARSSMYTDSEGNTVNADKDGVDENGVRVEGEHSTYTTLTAIERGAENSGANAEQIGGMDNVTQQIQDGNPVVLLGQGTIPPSDYKDGHYVTVSGYNSETGKYIVNDPTGKGPVEVSRDDLMNYAAAEGEPTNGAVSGVAISRGDGQEVAPATSAGQPAEAGETGQTSTTGEPITSLPPGVVLDPPKTTSRVPGCSQEQCAEWVQRVFRENGKPLPRNGDAGTLFGQEWPEGYEKQSNGQEGLPPQAGDVLLWGANLTDGKESNDYGHAALIQEVHADADPPYVLIAEANYGTNDGSTVPTRQVPYDPETNTLSNQGGSMPIQGWIHPEGENSLVNAQGGQDGNYVPGETPPAHQQGTTSPAPSGGTSQTSPQTGAPPQTETQPSTGTQPANPQEGAPEVQKPSETVMSPVGIPLDNSVMSMITDAFKEVMSGNLKGEAIQNLHQWYIKGDPKSNDPLRGMAASVLQMAGMNVGQNLVGPPGSTGLPPKMAQRMRNVPGA